MEKDLIKTIILENQARIPGLDVYDRNITFEGNVNYILTGQRRAGKTFLLYHRIQEMLEQDTHVNEILYINFEDERLLEFRVSDFNSILEAYKELFVCNPILFFDEIQNITGWEKFVRRLADSGYRIYITGSNATMLSREMATSLGGRFMIKEVETLSLNEFLYFNDLSLDENFEFTDQRFQVKRLFEEWFIYGGFPELLKFQDKKEYLNTIFQKVFLGDIISRHLVRNQYALNLMVKKMAESTMDEVSFNRIKNIIQSTGIKVGTATLIEYLDHLSDSFLIRSLENHQKKFTERETKKKYYFRDHGILGLFLSDPASRVLETIVFNHLLRIYPDNVYYLRNSFEVDFYIPGSLLVQASYSLESRDTRDREVNALIKAQRNYEVEELLIITYDREETIVANSSEIRVIPVWKWMLRSS
jgi:predicted AAA+ superfamily ATPase